MLETQRLVLRQWRDEDSQPFADMNADPRVMQYFPSTYAKDRSDALMARNKAHIEESGWGLWAAELKQTREFIGFIGLSSCSEPLPFAPCVEIGWRLSAANWGQGLASEGAAIVLEFAFAELKLERLVSFTAVSNTPSERVMQKIGLRNTGDNFMHPGIHEDHPLCEHVLYQLSREQWLAT